MTLPRRSFLKSIAAALAGATAVRSAVTPVAGSVEPTTIDVPEWGAKVGVRTETDKDRACREQWRRQAIAGIRRPRQLVADSLRVPNALLEDNLVDVQNDMMARLGREWAERVNRSIWDQIDSEFNVLPAGFQTTYVPGWPVRRINATEHFHNIAFGRSY